MPETCETCAFYEEDYDGKHCGKCTGDNSMYKPQDIPVSK